MYKIHFIQLKNVIVISRTNCHLSFIIYDYFKVPTLIKTEHDEQ